MRFLVKYASRGRPTLFARAIHNIKNTIQTKEYEILISADEDDRTMNNPQIRKFIAQTPHLKIVYGRSTSKVCAINRDMDQASPWDILVNMSDDMQFRVRGWDKKIIDGSRSVWGDSLDWFGHWNDSYIGSALSTMSIMGRTYYQRDNYIYHPSYKSFSCDAEAFLVALARKKHHYFPEVLFKHEHPANNKMVKKDLLYKINANHSSGDVKNYFDRLNNDFYLDIPGPHIWDEFKTKVTA